MRKLVLLIIAIILSSLTIRAQITKNKFNHSKPEFSKGLFNYQNRLNNYARLKSGEYQKLDSVIRPDYYKELTIYDDIGRNLRTTSYNLENGHWVIANKGDYFYDANGNLSLVTVYSWSVSTNQWLNDNKEELSYTDNKLSLWISSELVDNKWENYNKIEFTYNSNNTLATEINSLLGKDTIRNEYSYDNNNRQSQVLHWNWENNKWSNTGKTTYDYDANGNMILYTEYELNTSTNTWQPSYKGEFTYDTNNRPILTIHYERGNGDQWIYARKIDYTYPYTCSPNNLILPYYHEYYYDEYIDITAASFTMQRWDVDKNSWYLSYNEDKYFSDFVTESPVLTVSTNTLAIAAPANSTKTFDVTSNISWTAVSNQSWLTISSGSGTGNETLSLTATANPTTATRSATVTISGTGVTALVIEVTQDGGTTGIKDLEGKEYGIYPNPTRDILFFNSKLENVLISIFDLNGKMVMHTQTDKNQIDISNLLNGIYTIKIFDKSGVLIRKFVKQ